MFSSINKINQLLDRKAKMQFGLLFVLLIIKSFLDGLGLGLIAPYIAAIGDSSIIFNNSIFQKINLYTNIESSFQLISLMSFVLIIFFIIKNLFSLFVIYYQSRLVFTQRSDQSKTLFKLYMNAPYSYHLNHNTAELDRNVRFETPNVFAFIQNVLLLFSNIFLTISIFVVLMIANWHAVLTMGLFIFIVSSFFLFFSGRYSKMLGTELLESSLHLGQALKEGLSSIIEAKLHNIESFFPNRYHKHYMVTSKANWRQATIASAPNLFFEILAVGALVFVITILSIRNINIISVLPIIGLFSFSFIRLIPSVTAIIKSLQEIKFRIPAVDVIYADFKNLNHLDSQTNHSDDLKKNIDFKTLLIDNVNFAFPNGKNNEKTIEDLSLRIQRGQSIGITGPSGSGKTTVINMILGLLKPDSGIVSVNEYEIHDNIVKWRELIGYVPQSITLIDASIKENVALGLNTDTIDDDKVWSVLEESNLFEFVKDLPKQLNTFIGENGMRLSGGQRQRLGLARALYRDPEVLVFDEATSALDVETEKRITGEIMKLSGTRTLVIVAHRISTIKDCDIIYYLEDGKVLKSGTFEDLKGLL